MQKSLESVLSAHKLVTKEQLDECRGSGASLEQCLLDKGYITPENLARAWAQVEGLEYLETITEAMADPALLGRITLKFLRDHMVIPLKYKGNVVVAIADPRNYQVVDEVALVLGEPLSCVIVPSRIIIEAINRFYPLEGAKQMIAELEEEKEIGPGVDFEAIKEEDILGMASDAPIIKLVNHLLFQAVKRGASDIHIEPFEKEVVVRYRIDGVMYPALTPPKRVQAALTSRIKIMANLNIAEKRKPQDGRIMIKVADRSIDIRVSVLPVAHGERIVMRLLDKSRSFGALETLGFSARDLAVIKKSIARPNGIILVSGPTGSGKTSTLYTVLNTLNSIESNIVTVEDPVEYQMSGVGQVQVNEKIGLTFAAALRSILRQDPDIIMIGELRDQETAQIAIQAALTGHLVLSTIHTNSAPATVTRLIDMGVEPFLIASTIVSITAQRLVRMLCTTCKIAYQPSTDLIQMLGLSEKEGSTITFYKAVGCPECLNTGYRGRVAIFEIMEMTPEVAHLTMSRSDASVLRKQAVEDGMTLLVQDGIRKIKEGITSIEEVISVAVVEEPGEKDY